MASFMSKLGNILKPKLSQNINLVYSATNPSLFQSIRNMSSSKIFIGGLSYNTDDTSLREACSAYGEVLETKVIMDRETGRSRGFGFVSFTSGEEASKAIQALDGQDLHGRRVRVNYATDRVGFRNDWGAGNTGYGGDGGQTGAYTNDGYGENGGNQYAGNTGYGGQPGAYTNDGYGGNGGNQYADNTGNYDANDGGTAGGYASGSYGGNASENSGFISGDVNQGSNSFAPGGGVDGRSF